MMTATSVSREVYSQVTSGSAFSVSTRRRMSMAMVTEARENTAVTASFCRTGIFNRQRSGRGRSMTAAGKRSVFGAEIWVGGSAY